MKILSIKRLLTATLLSSGLFLSTSALALEQSLYLGLSLGESKYDVSKSEMIAAVNDGSLTSARVSNTDTAFRLYGGFWITNYFGAELGYADLGELSFRAHSDGSGSLYSAGPLSASLEVDGVQFGFAGRLPLSDWFDIGGRLGLYFWDMDIKATHAGVRATDSDDGADIYYGLGAAFRINAKLALHVDFDRYDIDGDDIDVLSAGVSVAF